MEKVSLNELKRKGLLRLPNGFGGSNLMDMETGWNRIFLKSTSLENKNTALRLHCSTAKGSEVSASIRSDDKSLLSKIRVVLEQQMIGKSISEIYSESLIIL